MHKVRCSSLPLIELCSASADTPSVRIEERCDAAFVGTDAHDHLQRMVETGSVDWEAIAHPETRSLVWHGQRMWRDLRDLFPAPVCERRLAATFSGIELSGHTDVSSGTVGIARVLDWKSGRVDKSYREQLIGYAALELLNNSMLDRVETHIAWLREEEVENYALDRADLPEFCERLTEKRLDVFSPGRHCVHCHRAHECHGLSSVVSRDATSLLDIDESELRSGLATMAPARILELSRQAKLVSTVADRVREAIRNHVEQNGDIEADGARLTLTEEQRRNIDTAAAWPVLQARLTDDELAQCVSVRLSKANEAIKKKAPPRNGAAHIREFNEELEAAGAVSYQTIKKLQERRI